jgi:hypothetical protein
LSSGVKYSRLAGFDMIFTANISNNKTTKVITMALRAGVAAAIQTNFNMLK